MLISVISRLYSKHAIMRKRMWDEEEDVLLLLLGRENIVDDGGVEVLYTAM